MGFQRANEPNRVKADSIEIMRDENEDTFSAVLGRKVENDLKAENIDRLELDVGRGKIEGTIGKKEGMTTGQGQKTNLELDGTANCSLINKTAEKPSKNHSANKEEQNILRCK